MRDVSRKPDTLRTASAEATLKCLPATIAAVRTGEVPKADPVAVARVAGIQAAKNTSLLIPYCHQVPLDYAGVEITLREDTIHVASRVTAVWKTGVEMEALAAASAAALTLYDMLKIIDDSMEVREVRLTGKKGGKSDFKPPASPEKLAAGVLVLSDRVSRGESEDSSGKALRERLESLGVPVREFSILPDDRALIAAELRRWADDLNLDIVITTGGTGIGPRDATPEATASVIERELPGVAEALRAHGQERNRYSMLSRGIAGIRGRTLIVNLPGSERAVNESLDMLLPWILHALDVLRGSRHGRE
ncbi:MAG TPA: bifunctional molybdenum cofactor biosynthesis protein MoaC/MoaB [Bacteroidota bacterium]|nr:bifunctional molybdenum cofactor biosynthesis protein MoaC/MoaB [Bacteroidota bacterium]